MDRGAGSQRFKVVAAFHHRQYPAFRMRPGDIQQRVGDPGEVVSFKPDLGQRVVAMCIEADRDDQETPARTDPGPG